MVQVDQLWSPGIHMPLPEPKSSISFHEHHRLQEISLVNVCMQVYPHFKVLLLGI